MCGVVGIAGKSPVNQMLFDALTMLQHRGQDAAGIVTCHEGRFSFVRITVWCVMSFILVI